MFYSPLRYPGGKIKLAKFIEKICEDNKINGHYIEPYAGGASVALYLLIENKVKEITINDLDRSIYAFWYSVLYKTDELCRLIEKTPISIEVWEKQKMIQKRKEKSDLLSLGFSTLFLNRTNISGIINGGVIGGKDQKGKYKMSCRFNKHEIIRRIKLIASYKKLIHLSNKDAIDLIKEIKIKNNFKDVIIYFDPPYFMKGASLYMNSYKKEDHVKVAKVIKDLKDFYWIVSYDDTYEIKKIYEWVKNKLSINLTYTARKTKIGNEILFFSDKFSYLNLISNSKSLLL
jgi:DNA adenine methylase